jgi:hypothetical protein
VTVTWQRALVVAWVSLSTLGALDHTIAERVLGRRFDLLLPHLKYGYVMFNRNFHTATVYEYAGADGVRHPLADLARTPAPGYPRARVALDALMSSRYLAELCLQATRASGQRYTFFETEYDVDVNPRAPAHTTALRCDEDGLAAQ